MTPHELILKLINCEGPCMRFCSYCPEDFNTAEVKECVENMLKENYALKEENDLLVKELIKIRKAYREITGNDYKGESE